MTQNFVVMQMLALCGLALFLIYAAAIVMAFSRYRNVVFYALMAAVLFSYLLAFRIAFC
jgi:hypothetical protein